jgi:hypothetical protein
MTDTSNGTAASVRKLKTKRVLTREDHALIQLRCNINAESGEDYACVFLRGKGFGQWSIHVFARQPTQREIDSYEQTASRLKFKGQKAQIEGSQITAAVSLYNLIVIRTYDVLVGLKSHDTLDRELTIAKVPPLIKREAIRQLIGEVYSESRLAEAEGADENEDTDDAEAHTSGGREDSEPPSE